MTMLSNFILNPRFGISLNCIKLKKGRGVRSFYKLRDGDRREKRNC